MAVMSMQQSPLINILPKVSPIVYGCMSLGGGWNNSAIGAEHVKQAHEVIDVALQAGINCFDHADIYTLGMAEMVFGRVFAQRPELRDQIYLQSKCSIRFEDHHAPKRYDLSQKWVTQSVDEILKRLNTNHLDVLVLHRPDPLMEPDELAEALLALKNAGKIRHVGVSNMHQHQMAFLQSALDEPLVVNQIEVSLQQLHWLEEGVYAGNPDGRDINFTAGTLEYCRQHNVQLQSWGSLCQGLFSGQNVSTAKPHIQQTAALVASLAAEYQASREAIVLAWLMRHPAKIQPVIGTTNLQRITACTEAVGINLSREHWYALYVSARGQELP